MGKTIIFLCFYICSASALLDLVFESTFPKNPIRFYLYQSSDVEIADEIIINDEDSVKNSRFNSSLPTKIIIHGWTHGRKTPWLREMREAMANTNKWNVLVVDWSPLSHNLYILAKSSNKNVAQKLTDLIVFLREIGAVKLSTLHLIGHSMGAHISGIVGLTIKNKYDEKISRITGLDPAGYLYQRPFLININERLDPSDADFVDAIHTDDHKLGMTKTCGHVDFYPNGGTKQPGCRLIPCNHDRACEYWTVSIKKPDYFKAYMFPTWKEYQSADLENLQSYPMGIDVNSEMPQGTYFLETPDEIPYIKLQTTFLDSIL